MPAKHDPARMDAMDIRNQIWTDDLELAAARQLLRFMTLAATSTAEDDAMDRWFDELLRQPIEMNGRPAIHAALAWLTEKLLSDIEARTDALLPGWRNGTEPATPVAEVVR